MAYIIDRERKRAAKLPNREGSSSLVKAIVLGFIAGLLFGWALLYFIGA